MSFTNFKTQLFFAVLFFTLLSQVVGHSYVTSPRTRGNQVETQTGCRGPACFGPCEVPLSRKTRQSTTVQRGDTITVKWPRNNHAGGFIRFAWAPTSLSDSHTEFDKHVQQINCHEVGGCRPDNAADPNGGDSGPADGSSRACTSVITVPLDLPDGEWTLQWAWFGGAFALGDYYSCIDYKIAGGAVGSMTPVFIGGDYTYPNQNKCKFFNTDKLRVCTTEPCVSGNFPNSAQQSGVPAYDFVSNQVPQLPLTPDVNKPATSASRPSPPVTTGMRTPMTTSRVAIATTGAVIEQTPPVVIPTLPIPSQPTPSEPVPSPSPVPESSTPSTPTIPSTPTLHPGCILGNQFCIGSSQFQTCTNGRDGNYYAPPQSCQTGTSCHPSSTENKIYCY